MSPRRLLHIPRHTVRVTAYLVAGIVGAGVLLFFGLTRTEVGRDALRQQIEQQFTETFEGHLEIGALKGNLVQHLFADEVRLFDPEGRLVLHIDSVVAKPNWSDLLRQRFSVGSLTVIRPTLHLFYQSDSTWNIAHTFRRRTPLETPSAPQAWSFDSADLHLIEGLINTQYEEALPPGVASGWLFNYADAHGGAVELRATIEWGTDIKLIDVLSFSASVPEIDWSIEDIQGQVVIEPERLLINQLIVNASAADLRFDGILDRFDALRTDSLANIAIDGALTANRIDFGQLRRLAPRLPVDDQVAVSVQIQGPLSQLVIEDLTVSRGQSRLQTTGTLLGFPDSLDFDLALNNSALAAADLHAVLPSVGFLDLDHLGTVSIRGTAAGIVQNISGSPPLEHITDLTFEVRGIPGHLLGTVTLQQQPNHELRYTLDLSTDSLDVGLITQKNNLASSINGRVRAEGRGLSLDSLNSSVHADFYATEIAGRRADSIHIEASVLNRRLETIVTARQDRQRLFANAVLNWNTQLPSYQMGLITRRLDLGMLLDSDSLRSSLNSQWTLEGEGLALDELQGELAVTFEASEMQWGSTIRPIPAHRSILTLNTPGISGPRLSLTGDALSFRVDDIPPMAALQPVTTLWTQVLGEAWMRQVEKVYAQANPTLTQETSLYEELTLDQLLLRENVRRSLQASNLDSLILNLILDVHRADIIGALLPMAPPIVTDLHTQVRIMTDADQLRVNGSARADSIILNTLTVDDYRVDFQTYAHLNAPLEASLQINLDARADTIFLAKQRFPQPHATAAYADRQGTLAVSFGTTPAAGPASLTAALNLFPDRFRLTLQDFDFTLGGYIWRHAKPEAVDLFADAALIPNVLLESQPTEGGQTQRIRLHGALSKAPRDTLFVELEAIGLEQLSDFLSGKRSFGGRLNGQVALTGALQRELTGAVAIENLSLDDRRVGDLHASSRYLPGLPDIALDVAILPISLDTPPPDAQSGFRLVENDIHLTGTFRLPKTTTDDPGALDLQVDVKRADAFFFEYIVKELTAVEGAFSGSGTVQGTFQYPLFEADMALTDGRFEVPAVNLSYQIEGPIRVDKAGFQLDQIVLTDDTQGTAVLSGSILFNEYRFFSLDITGQLDEILVIDVPTFSRELPFYGTIWASGDATLNGTVDNAFIRSTNATTSASSELFIPITTVATFVDPGFIIFADSTEKIEDIPLQTRRDNILDDRPIGERTFLEGIEMDLNILAPQGSTVHLVIDPLLGDVINAVGSGRIQLQRREGDIFTFGSFEVDSGDYLFTAGEVFVRRFLINEGTITWTSDPLNPRVDIEATYRTRASRTGLPDDVSSGLQSSLPLIVELHITGELNAVLVDLNLALDRTRQEAISDTPLLEAYLNQPDQAAQHATSVLLTNSFLLSTEGTSNDVLAGSAFNSVSALVSSQLNRYLSQVLSNADFTLGVQSDEAAADLDVSAGIAIRLLNERLVIRGQGVYRGLGDQVEDTAQQGLEGEFIVEVRLSPTVSVEVFYRREGDVLSESLITSETGAGLSYHTEFSTWRKLFQRIFGRKKNTVASDSSTIVVEAEGK